MGVFEHFPQTNFHDLNLDWILQTVKNNSTELAKYIGVTGDMQISFENLKTWCKEQGLTEAAAVQLNKWKNDGTLANLINENLANSKLDSNIFNNYVTSKHKLDYKTISVTLSPTRTSITFYGANTINHLKDMGADVTLVVMCNIENANSNSVELMDANTLNAAIDEIQNSGIKIQMLKPHIGVNWSDGFYRANHLPTDYDEFFSSWTGALLQYAAICHTKNIPILCIGCEQSSYVSTTFDSRWSLLCSTLKNAYPDLKLTYAHNDIWDVSGIPRYCSPFNYVDMLGLNIYRAYTTKILIDNNITVGEIIKGIYCDPTYSINAISEISQYSRMFGNKPLFITEIGAAPYTGCLRSPIPPTPGDPSHDAQAILLEAVFNTYCQCQNMKGIAIWHIGEPFNIYDDGVFSKAEAVVTEYFKGGIL